MRLVTKALCGLATVFAAVASSSGAAQAGAPTLSVPYADPGCGCFAMFPAQPKTERISGTGREGLGTPETSVLAPAVNGVTVRMTYWNAPADTTYDLDEGMSAVGDLLAAAGMESTRVTTGTFRNHPSITGEFREKDKNKDTADKTSAAQNGSLPRRYSKVLIFTLDGRGFALRVDTAETATPADGAATFRAFADSFQSFQLI